MWVAWFGPTAVTLAYLYAVCTLVVVPLLEEDARDRIESVLPVSKLVLIQVATVAGTGMAAVVAVVLGYQLIKAGAGSSGSEGTARNKEA